MTKISSILALDVGEKRIGVALANSIARLAVPHITLDNDEHVVQNIKNLVEEHNVTHIVVGNPRDMQGNATPQTTFSHAFADSLQNLGLPITFQDESLTSVHAEEALRNSGEPFSKQDIDAMAAALILRDYLSEQPFEESYA